MSVREQIRSDELEIAHSEPGRFEPPHLRTHIDLVEPLHRPSAQRVAAVTFFVVAALWFTFLAVMFIDGERLTDLWAAFRDQFLVLQVIEAVLLLPWALGLAIWNTDWDLWVRYIAITGTAWTTAYLFYPWKEDQS